jgi:Ni/Fe-hydrogenase 1 B-type cytochrome subunit
MRTNSLSDARHPIQTLGSEAAIYVWQYPLRMFHWGMVLSIAVLSFTGYYIHDPFIVGEAQYPFLMGWFRFTHELFGMVLTALFLMRMALFFQGNRWIGWRQYVHQDQWKEMWQVLKFYTFFVPKPVSRIGHNAIAAFSYLCVYGMIAVEIVTGLVMYNGLMRTAVLNFFLGWIPGVVNIQNLRLIHFLLMFALFAFFIFHIHLCMLISRVEKRGLMDSIFIGYKVIPVKELEAEEKRAALGER